MEEETGLPICNVHMVWACQQRFDCGSHVVSIFMRACLNGVSLTSNVPCGCQLSLASLPRLSCIPSRSLCFMPPSGYCFELI